MQSLKHIKTQSSCSILLRNQIHRLSFFTIPKHHYSSSSSKNGGGEEWNDTWESAWLPEDLSAKHRAPWETDVNFSSASEAVVVEDSEAKAFVEDMNENWNQRKGSKPKSQEKQQNDSDSSKGSLYSLENMKKDYRLKKQRIHAGLWMKEIEKEEEAKLGDSMVNGGDDIEKLLDSCSEYVFLSYFCCIFGLYCNN